VGFIILEVVSFMDVKMKIARATDATFTSMQESITLNEKQNWLIMGVQDTINGILENMRKDPFYAPADWILENLWNTLQAVRDME
jgi:hypothetical protein